MVRNPVCRIYWLEGGSARLEELPWAEFPPETFDLKILSFQNNKASIETVAKAANSDTILLVIFDVDNEKELAYVNSLPEQALVFIVAPGALMQKAKTIINRTSVYFLQKPLRINEFFLIIEKSIVMEYFKAKNKQLAHEELEWLLRIEKVFELGRREQIEKDKTLSAYEHLVQYEQGLSEEQKFINEALISLQEFRDSEKKEWEKEREARQTVEDLQVAELKAKDKTLKAQANLLEYNRNLKIAYFQLLDEFKSKGTLSSDQIKALLDEYRSLLSKIEAIAE